jgi:hypothetical protein
MAETGPGEGRGGTGGMDPGELMDGLDALRQEITAAAQRVAEQLELERRMQENPMAVLGIAAGAGFVLGGGLWPLLRPFVKAAAKGVLSPSNLMAITAALGAMRAAADRRESGEGVPATEEPQTH